MFEEMTYENIMDEMLSNVPSDVDTREGSVIYDAVAPIAMELAQAYLDIGMVLDECFADTASYYYLIKRAAERGIMVREGTSAVVKILCSPATVDVPIGTEFNIGDLNYTVSESLGGGYYNIICGETGVSGNNTSDEIIPMDDIEDLESVTVVEIVSPGTDDEDEESLRERYFDSFTEVSYGGNKAEYKEKANGFTTVGGCKVIPAWNGGGTVKLLILGSDFNSASESVVAGIQNAFDPAKDGSGVGIAPIGHIVTVDTATEVAINVVCTISYINGYTWDDIKDTFATDFESYLLELRQTWEDMDTLSVRSGKIEAILLDITGVDDVTNVSINGGSGNYTVASDCIPIGGVYSG